jgi:hypothetical protein
MATDPKIIKLLSEDLENLNNIIDDIAVSIKGKLNASLTDTKEELEDITKSFKEGKDITKELESNLKKINKESVKLALDKKSIQAQLNDLVDDYNKKSISQQKIGENKFKKQQESLNQQLKQISAQLELNAAQGAYLTLLKEENDKRHETNRVLEKTQKIYKGLAALPIVALFKSILGFALKADEQTTELAKSLGISKDQARGLYQNFSDYAASANDSFVTTTKLLEAQSQLSEQLGISVKYSGKQAEDFSRLTKLMGLSAEQAGKLAKLSIVNGTSIEATTKSIIRGSAASQRSNRIAIDQRTILKDVANLSEGILIKFQGNPEALGAAVVQAKKLGLTLDQVDKVGESLLNWESSIENELKAELITGKQINLEKARYAALTGDQATLMAELSNQVGTLNDYQNMNVIAQKSLAEAFGMSRDEMSKMLLDQEKANKLGDASKLTLDAQLEALKAQGEPLDSALYKQIQQQSIQEKFNNAVEKMQDLIGNLVAGPLGQLIDGFADLAKHSGVIVSAMITLASISLTKTLMGLATMATELELAAAGAIATASAVTLGIGIAAVIAGIIAATGAFDSAKPQEVKDGIAPSDKGPFTITDAYGATAITSKGDGLAVSPNINKGGGGSTDFSPMIAAINEVRNAVNELKNRPAIAYINGEDAFARNLGTVNALGTSQTQNSYKLA